jgi:hypothetical protein
MENIIGEMFRNCFPTTEDFEKGYKNSVFYVDKNFLEEYRKHMVAMDHIANFAKSYILNNWQKVEDWSDLDVTVRAGNTGKKTHYYKYVERDPFNTRNVKVAEMFEEMREEEKNNQNPIRVFNNVVLDPTDGDFSVTINDTEHWWIDDDAIITIADYIEKQLEEKEKSETIGTSTED